jgi:hypothetical protein
VTFDESNGSQGKQVDIVIGMEEPSSKAIKKLAIGEIKPQEQVDQDDDDELMLHGPSNTAFAVQPGYSGHMSGDSESPVRSIRTEARPIRENEAESSTPHQDHPQAKKDVAIQHQSP